MAHIVLQGLKLKVVEPTKKKKEKSTYSSSKKLYYGKVLEDNGEFKVSVDIEENGKKETIILSLTPESFDLTGRQHVFRRQPADNGKREMVIRDIYACKYFPGLPEQYIPFDVNWTIKGNIIKNGFIKLFNFKELIGINTYIL